MSYAQARWISSDAIPVIDMSGLRDGGAALQDVAGRMREAAESVGFFYVRGHGVPQPQIDGVFDCAARFFAAPLETKQMVSINQWHRGFLHAGAAKMYAGAKPDLKESFVWGLDTAAGPVPEAGIPPNRWPDFVPDMRRRLVAYFAACNEVGWRLLRAFATSIGAPADTFVRYVARPTSRASLIYYPPQGESAGADQFGVAPHTDYGCLTLLYQNEIGGLQVQAADGAWVTAHPIPGTFVVNVGDLLARWTNDRFRSTPHRVVNQSGRERFSAAVFVDPDADTVIEPVVQPGEVSRYDAVTCSDYIRSRLDAAFAYRKAAAG